MQRLGGNMVWTHKTAPELEVKPLARALAFALATRRHAATASINVWSIARAMDERDGVNRSEEQ